MTDNGAICECKCAFAEHVQTRGKVLHCLNCGFEKCHQYRQQTTTSKNDETPLATVTELFGQRGTRQPKSPFRPHHRPKTS